MNAARAKQPIPDEDLPPDLLALKRAAEADGITIHLAGLNATWELPEPIVLPEGVSASDIVIRNRGKEP